MAPTTLQPARMNPESTSTSMLSVELLILNCVAFHNNSQSSGQSKRQFCWGELKSLMEINSRSLKE
jgi:hypothetical protein